MDKIKLLTIAVSGLLLLNFGMLAKMMFQHPPHGPGPGPGPDGRPGGPKMIIIERLKLDAEQQKKYEVMVDYHKSTMDSLHQAGMKMKDELYGLLKSGSNDSILTDPILLRIAENEKKIEMLN